MAYVILLVLGVCFGSFINALVWRIHEQAKSQKLKAKNRTSKELSAFSFQLSANELSANELSILKGRSMCPHCRHTLAGKDLVPLLSWLRLKGRCRYCHKPISLQYPLVEAASAAIFALSYLFWPVALTGGGQWVLFITWLAVLVGLIALLIYDAKWMLLPNKIIYPTFFIALAGRLTYIIGFAPDKALSFELLALSLLAASGVFGLLFYLSKGRWIGFGDVRLGLVTGTVLGRPSLSLLMIFIASVLGTIASLPGILSGRQSFTSKLPFGPFLIAATALSLLFGPDIISWYKNLAGL